MYSSYRCVNASSRNAAVATLAFQLQCSSHHLEAYVPDVLTGALCWCFLHCNKEPTNTGISLSGRPWGQRFTSCEQKNPIVGHQM